MSVSQNTVLNTSEYTFTPDQFDPGLSKAMYLG